MAKIIVNPSVKRKDNMDDHVLKVMFDDNEPPKNYIWARPDGNWYQWKDGCWKKLFQKSNTSDLSNYVTKDVLNQKLNTLKTDILTFLVKSLNGVSGSDEALTKYVKEYLEPKLNELVVSSSEQETTNTNVDSRLSELESIDHSQFLTQHQDLTNYYKKGDIQYMYVSKNDLEESVSELGFVKADTNAITDLAERVQILENKSDNDTVYDDTGLTEMINNVGNRVSVLENKVDDNTIYNATEITTKVDNITNRVTALESKPDNDTLYDDEITRIDTEIASVTSTVSKLQNIDHEQYITAEDIE